MSKRGRRRMRVSRRGFSAAVRAADPVEQQAAVGVLVDVGCCEAGRVREVLPGGTVVFFLRHALRCPVWSAR